MNKLIDKKVRTKDDPKTQETTSQLIFKSAS